MHRLLCSTFGTLCHRELGKKVPIVDLFHEHMSIYGLNYKTDEEYRFRMALFEAQNTKLDEIMSRSGNEFVVAHNKFSTWTTEEYTLMLDTGSVARPTRRNLAKGGKVGRGKPDKEVKCGGKGKNAVPCPDDNTDPVDPTDPTDPDGGDDGTAPVPPLSFMSWYERGLVNRPKNQGSTCSSGWAHATVTVVENQMAQYMNTTSVPTLSEQQLIDCDTTNNGCDGGEISTAFQFGGHLWWDSEYPFEGITGERCLSGTDLYTPDENGLIWPAYTYPVM